MDVKGLVVLREVSGIVVVTTTMLVKRVDTLVSKLKTEDPLDIEEWMTIIVDTVDVIGEVIVTGPRDVGVLVGVLEGELDGRELGVLVIADVLVGSVREIEELCVDVNDNVSEEEKESEGVEELVLVIVSVVGEVVEDEGVKVRVFETLVEKEEPLVDVED